MPPNTTPTNALGCDCVDCLASESPCQGDCYPDEPCRGCADAMEAWKDRVFDEQEALGYNKPGTT